VWQPRYRCSQAIALLASCTGSLRSPLAQNSRIPGHRMAVGAGWLPAIVCQHEMPAFQAAGPAHVRPKAAQDVIHAAARRTCRFPSHEIGPGGQAAGPSTVKTASSTATGGTEHVSGTAAAGACESQGGSAAAGACEGQGRAVTLPTGSDAPSRAAVPADSRNSGTHFQPMPIPVRRFNGTPRRPSAQAFRCLSALPVLIVTHRSLPSSR
jgi:hypothetical protein